MIRLMEAVFLLPLEAHRKLVLLALADNASENGRCWPGQESIARRASISTRHVRDHLKALEADGYLSILSAGNGRGNTAQYLLNVALIMSGSAFSGKGEKADPIDNKGGPLADKGGPLRHAYKEEPSEYEPSGTVNMRDATARASDPPVRARKRRTQDAPNPLVSVVMQRLEETRGYVSEHYAAEAKAVKGLLSHDYTTDEIMAAYLWLKQQPWWRDKALTMMSLAGQIGEWKQQRNGGNNGAVRQHPQQDDVTKGWRDDRPRLAAILAAQSSAKS